MPELPEVETIKNTLIPLLTGRKILSVDILRNSLVTNDPTFFKSALKNKDFSSLSRKGKYLFFHLSDEKVVICHFAMEGRFYIFEENKHNSTFARVVFHLDNNTKLIYDDSRCFGMLKLTTESDYLKEKEIAKLGKEPFDIDDVDELIAKTCNSNIAIKTTIMDQSIIAGIGNIYADETLFSCKINPMTPASKITKNQWEEIVKYSREVLTKAIKQGGSTIKSYESAEGVHGRFQQNLQAYGKYGENCPRCGTPFRFTKVGGRGTTYCPCCQKKINNPLKVAIVGKMGVGKSAVLEEFAKKDCFAISSDEIVSLLYSDYEIVEQINNMFGLTFFGEVDKNILREYLINHPNQKQTLEQFIHPLVYKTMNKLFKNSKKNILVAEVPLLFESGHEDDFDYIILINADEEERIRRISLRNPSSNKELNQIYDSKTLDKNKEKADFIIDNNFDLLALGDKVDEVFNILLSRLS